MAVQHSKWRRNNDGVYVRLDIGHTETFVIDLKNELRAGDFLNTCIATSTSTDILLGFTVRTDFDEGFEYPHQQLVTLTPQAIGVHPIKLTSTTQNGITIVKHFDVLTER